jgi:hypothetical protein
MEWNLQMTRTDRLYLDIVQPFLPKHTDMPDAEELEAIRFSALRHGQFMLVCWRLKKIAAGNPDVSAFLKSNEVSYLSGIALAMQQEAVEKRVMSMLGAESIPSLVIKGSALASEIYGDINSRVSSDIDMLIRHKDAAAVDQLLSQDGFVRQGDKKFEFYLLRIHHAQYSKPGDNKFIEMHWHFAIPCFFNLSYEEIWAGVRKQGKDNCVLSPEMTILLLLIHHHSHEFRHLGVLTDILWAFYKYRQAIDWQLLLPVIKRSGLANTAAITCGQIEDLWGDYVEELPLADFRQAGMGGPGRMGRYFRLCPGRTGNRAYLDKIAKRLALDGCGRVFLSFIKALFPPLVSIRRDETKENRFLAYSRYLKEIIGCWLEKK